ncbi:MAG: ATP-binding cassette domain-containing protein [Bacteroidales bacterium]
MSISINHISKRFGSLRVYDDFSLDIPDGKITCILGPSGCGKTTLLHMMNGTLSPDSGSLNGLKERAIAFVFQEPRLLPWKTVRGNLEFILGKQVPVIEIKTLIDHTLDLVGLQEFQDHYPAQLSGGMKQRLALARAFAFPAEIILMDEPFRGLDPALKQLLMETFRKLWNEKKPTVVFVTHDLDDAFNLGGEILVLGHSPVQLLKKFVLPESENERFVYRNEILSLMGMVE